MSAFIRRAVLAFIGVLLSAAIAATVGAHFAHADTRPLSRSQAEEVYRQDLGTSKAWRKAGKAERRHALKVYRTAYGAGNGCSRDLRHAYQGTTRIGRIPGTHKRTKGPRYVLPGLPVYVVSVKGPNVLFGEYTDGICGD